MLSVLHVLKQMTITPHHNRYKRTQVVWPSNPLVQPDSLDRFILSFLDHNPEGVTNSDVGKAMGLNDSKKRFSFAVLERLITKGKVEKHAIRGSSLYFSVR